MTALRVPVRRSVNLRASWVAARRSGFIAVSVCAGDLADTIILCAQCLKIEPTNAELNMVGPLRVATSDDLARCVCCSSCGADLTGHRAEGREP